MLPSMPPRAVAALLGAATAALGPFAACWCSPSAGGQVDAARARGIPVTSITETLIPPNATFQDWQAAQLPSLQTGLAEAGG